MISILSNIPELKDHDVPEVSIGFEERWGLTSELVSGFSTLRKALRHDAILLSNPNPSMMVVAILIRIFSLGRARLYFYDVLLAPASGGVGEWLRRTIRRLASMAADRIFLVHLDYDTYAHELGADRERLEFVGFKCNNHERLDGAPEAAVAGDYVLACGQSYRDYPTFFAAMARLSIPAIVLLAPKTDLTLHGSWFPESAVPGNVTVVEHDGSVQSWDKFLREARMVVLPLRKDAIQPAGISVCLEAMAWGKAVILSEGPLTHGGLMGPPAAALFPPEDPEALGKIIQRLWNDEKARSELADHGAAVARRFGGIRRMSEALIKAVVARQSSTDSATARLWKKRRNE